LPKENDNSKLARFPCEHFSVIFIFWSQNAARIIVQVHMYSCRTCLLKLILLHFLLDLVTAFWNMMGCYFSRPRWCSVAMATKKP